MSLLSTDFTKEALVKGSAMSKKCEITNNKRVKRENDKRLKNENNVRVKKERLKQKELDLQKKNGLELKKDAKRINSITMRVLMRTHV
jgi:hypothetical protein